MPDAGPLSVSVVIPSYRAWRTLPLVLDALEREVVPGVDVVLVDSTGDGAAAALEASRPWLRVLALPERTLPGRSRNLGVEMAGGDLIAFLDADAVPDPGWLAALAGALGPDHDAVAGAVANGTPRSATGTAQFLLEFTEWLPGRGGPRLHGASCNLLVRRGALAAAGSFPEDMWPGEDTVLTFGFGRAGRLVFAPEASVRHLNRTGLLTFLAHQHRLGVAFGRICRRVDFPHRTFGRPVLAPAAVVLRIGALALRLGGTGREAAAAVALSPLLLAGLIAWGVGVARSPWERRS